MSTSLPLMTASAAATPLGSRVPPAPSTSGDGAAWQRAFDAAPGARQLEAGRLLDLNGEVPMAARPLSVVAESAQPLHAVSIVPTPIDPHAEAAMPLAAVRAPLSTGAIDSQIDARPPAGIEGRPKAATNAANPDASDPPRSDGMPASALARDLAPPQAGGSMRPVSTEMSWRAIDAYAASMVDAGIRDPALSFTLTIRQQPRPIRVHVQWRGRVADVWIGLHRHALEQLPDVRGGIHSWVAARGGVVGRLVCNGETLESSAQPHSLNFTGEP